MGVILICLEEVVVSVRARIRPKIVTISAVNLRDGGMVIIGVLVGKKFRVMISPAIMLPQARRSIGAVIAW